jgi:hypothetical protein
MEIFLEVGQDENVIDRITDHGHEPQAVLLKLCVS